MIGPTAAIALAMRDAGIEDADGKAASVLDALTRNNWRVTGPEPRRRYRYIGGEGEDEGTAYIGSGLPPED